MTNMDEQRLFESLQALQRQIGAVDSKVERLIARADADAEADRSRDARIGQVAHEAAASVEELEGRMRKLEDWKLKVVTAVAIAGGAGAAVGTAAEQIIRAITSGG